MKKSILVVAAGVALASSAWAQSSGFGFYDVQRSQGGRRVIIHDYQTGEMIEAQRRLGGVEVFGYGATPMPKSMFSDDQPQPPVFEGHRYGQEWKAWGNFQDD